MTTNTLLWKYTKIHGKWLFPTLSKQITTNALEGSGRNFAVAGVDRLRQWARIILYVYRSSQFYQYLWHLSTTWNPHITTLTSTYRGEISAPLPCSCYSCEQMEFCNNFYLQCTINHLPALKVFDFYVSKNQIHQNFLYKRFLHGKVLNKQLVQWASDPRSPFISKCEPM